MLGALPGVGHSSAGNLMATNGNKRQQQNHNRCSVAQAFPSSTHIGLAGDHSNKVRTQRGINFEWCTRRVCQRLQFAREIHNHFAALHLETKTMFECFQAQHTHGSFAIKIAWTMQVPPVSKLMDRQ